MYHNTPHDKSGYLPPRQGAYNNRIDVLIARIEDRITLLLEGNCIDELSAYQREQLAARYSGLLLRLLILLGKVETDETESHVESPMDDELRAIVGPPRSLPGTTGPDLA